MSALSYCFKIWDYTEHPQGIWTLVIFMANRDGPQSEISEVKVDFIPTESTWGCDKTLEALQSLLTRSTPSLEMTI